MKTRKFSLVPVVLLSGVALLMAGCVGPNLVDSLTHFSSLGIIGMIIVVLDVIALVEIFGSKRTTGDKVLWALFIIFFPVLGLIVYYFFARR